MNICNLTYNISDKKKQQEKSKKNKQIEKIEPPKKEITEDKNNVIQETQRLDKPIDIYYNQGKIVYGDGLTNEDELKNFQSKIYLNYRYARNKFRKRTQNNK